MPWRMSGFFFVKAHMEEEHFFTCPYCWQRISMVLDTSVDKQRYIEDCEVCCNPIEVEYETEAGRVIRFEARRPS